MHEHWVFLSHIETSNYANTGMYYPAEILSSRVSTKQKVFSSQSWGKSSYWYEEISAAWPPIWFASGTI